MTRKNVFNLDQILSCLLAFYINIFGKFCKIPQYHINCFFLFDKLFLKITFFLRVLLNILSRIYKTRNAALVFLYRFVNSKRKT